MPFDPSLSLFCSPPSRSLFLNFSGSSEIIRQLARPCSYSNTYIHRPLRCLLPEGRGLFKLKSRQDLNFKISIWLANLSASFRPCANERTTAFPSPPRRGQIARVQHQKSFTSRALFPPSLAALLLVPFTSCFARLLLVLLRKVVELKISSLSRNTRADDVLRTTKILVAAKIKV